MERSCSSTEHVDTFSNPSYTQEILSYLIPIMISAVRETSSRQRVGKVPCTCTPPPSSMACAAMHADAGLGSRKWICRTIPGPHAVSDGSLARDEATQWEDPQIQMDNDAFCRRDSGSAAWKEGYEYFEYLVASQNSLITSRRAVFVVCCT